MKKFKQWDVTQVSAWKKAWARAGKRKTKRLRDMDFKRQVTRLLFPRQQANQKKYFEELHRLQTYCMKNRGAKTREAANALILRDLNRVDMQNKRVQILLNRERLKQENFAPGTFPDLHHEAMHAINRVISFKGALITIMELTQ